MARARIGDIIEIQTAKGFAYAQYTHNHTEPPKYGQLLRVFEGTHVERPRDFDALAHSPVQFITFFPLHTALTRDIFQVVGNVLVPKEAQAFPLFRVKGLIDKETKKARRWGLWDGEGRSTTLNRPLTEAEKCLPILGVINDTLLVERIETGWRSELDIHT